MKKIESSDFKGPRAYFTNFDYRIVSRSSDINLLRKDVERRLKILLLTKHTVVCAASHLTSEFAYSLFRDNPILLEEELVVPALRRDRRDMTDVFGGKDVQVISTSQAKEMTAFYENNVKKVVSWDLFDNSSWFRNNFLQQLSDKNSILRRSLKKTSQKQLGLMEKQVESNPILERETIEEFAKNLKRTDSVRLLNFRELLYHISGSRVVRCEGSLPQENYIDYNLVDISDKNTSLSDVNIFWKIFLEVAFDTLRKPSLPIELLDLLTFEHIHKIRQPLLDGEFQEKYDEIIKRSIQAITSDNPNEIILNVNQIMLIRDKIQLTFDEIFEKEITDFGKKKLGNLRDTKSLAKSSTSLALGALGFVPNPLISILANSAGLLIESPSFFINLFDNIKTRASADQYIEYLKIREATLRKVIKQSEISEKTPLLDAVDILSSALSDKVRI